VRSTDLVDQMRALGVLRDWESGARGRARN